ncbi:MAG: NADH-quinone oxidoreductase subunit J [Bacteroidetes bacterium]|nr:NADH-quinone oxidoreductase subunit J [Bacteroidota bacterium]
MSGNQIMFVIFSAIILIFSILTVTSRRILRAATFLLIVLISTAAMYFMLNYQFLAAVQLTLYAGGIVVLIIFSILLTSHIDEKFETPALMKKVYAAIAAIMGAVLVCTTLLNYTFTQGNDAAKDVNMNLIGNSLISWGEQGYALPFELISILLLAAMIAAIVVAKKVKTK